MRVLNNQWYVFYNIWQIKYFFSCISFYFNLYLHPITKQTPQKIMKTYETNHAAKSKVHSNEISTGRTLINSLSPNFTYTNKSGGIVQPNQCLIY